MNQKSQIGFYFHIPFCPHICPYCDFIKTSHFEKKDVVIYFKQLGLQLEYFLNLLKISKLKVEEQYATAYFGGGTPGLFKAHFYLPLLNKLREYFILEEVTLETNPYTNYQKNFQEYQEAGFDRITLGAQSLCPQTLKILGRKHSQQDILKNLEWARQSGFENIQVDLIYGLKSGVRTISVDKEIEILYDEGASGLSAYFLTLEKRTLFANSNLGDEENGSQEYLQILRKCKELNLIQMETSNFSKFSAKHNNLYWYGYPYIGIGTGAHGLLPATEDHPYGRRYKIGENIQSSEPGNDVLVYRDEKNATNHFQIVFEKPRTKQDYFIETIFTQLRTPTGLKLDWIKTMTGDLKIVEKFFKHGKIGRAIGEGKILCDQEKIYLSAEEKIRGDSWALDFINALNL